MLIDWFTVGAQLLNFLILVWLLRRFLYQPILDALDAREARIAAELADAEARWPRRSRSAMRLPTRTRHSTNSTLNV
jgi:F-type H+-transporting ATPase subunit b